MKERFDMKHCFMYVCCFFLVLICSCATRQAATDKAHSSLETLNGPAPTPEVSVLSKKNNPAPLFGKILKEIAVSGESFNPAQGETVNVGYTLTQPATVTIRVVDPDMDIILTHSEDKVTPAGNHTFVWNGKDMDGKTVPDEAYFFTITARGKNGDTDIFDPTTFSGGETHDITAADIDPQYYTIQYTMPEMGRVMVRMGIQGGPLLNQLVDWKPRVKGVITEYWDGMDTDHTMNMFNHPDFKMIVSYFDLPDHSVITYGNPLPDFVSYKEALLQKRSVKPQRKTSVSPRSPHFTLSRAVDYIPKIHVDISNVKHTDENGIPVLNGKAMVTVNLAEKDKAVFERHPFEICFFLDHVFYAEDETGYTPFNWVWDLSDVTPGEHVLSVNISSFQDQIGMMSKKVRVVK